LPESNVKTYKLFRMKEGHLYPLFVETGREMKIGKWLEAGVGELVDPTHVKSKLGPLALRPGFHSTEVPFADWIGKRQSGILVQRKDTVWCECEVDGQQEHPSERYGKQTLPEDWYYFRTKPNQPFPWIISNRIKITRVLDHAEVEAVCRAQGVVAQKMEE
jgi:hypothetical protein